MSPEERYDLLRLIAEWSEQHAALVPDQIRGHLNRIRVMAGTWVSDYGLQVTNGPDAIAAYTFDWALVRAYEALLRRLLVKAERAKSVPTEQETATSAPLTSRPGECGDGRKSGEGLPSR